MHFYKKKKKENWKLEIFDVTSWISNHLISIISWKLWISQSYSSKWSYYQVGSFSCKNLLNCAYHTMKFQNCVEIRTAVKDSMVKAQRSIELFFRAGKSITTLYVLDKFDNMNNSSEESNLTRILLLIACRLKRFTQSTL